MPGAVTGVTIAEHDPLQKLLLALAVIVPTQPALQEHPADTQVRASLTGQDTAEHDPLQKPLPEGVYPATHCELQIDPEAMLDPWMLAPRPA